MAAAIATRGDLPKPTNSSDEEWNLHVEDLLSFLGHFSSGSIHHHHQQQQDLSQESNKVQQRGGSFHEPPVVQTSESIKLADARKNRNLPKILQQTQQASTEQAWKEAEQARQQARDWARKMRTVVTQWLEDDRKLAKQYKNEESCTLKAYQDAIAQLEEKVQRLEQESKDALTRYLSGEEALHQIIEQQHLRIRELERQIRESKTLPEARINRSEDDSDCIRTHRTINATEDEQVIEQGPRANGGLEAELTLEQGTSPQASSDTTIFEACTPNHDLAAKLKPGMTPGERSVPVSPDSEDNDDDSLIFSEDTRASSNRHVLPASFQAVHREEASQSDKQPTPRPPVAHAPPSTTKSENRRRRRRRRLRSPRGHPIIQYGNGATKETMPDGTSIVKFANGDIQITQGLVAAYYYSSSDVFSVGRPDGSIVWEFPDGQVEQHWPDGRRVVFGPEMERPKDYALMTAKEVLDLEQLDLLTLD
ncbi:hypothetical protein ACA910_014453 [Epithemia clementina (nom. ined.)]